MKQRFEYKTILAYGYTGLPGSGSYESDSLIADGYRVIKISRHRDGTRGFIVVYERPIESVNGKVGES